MTKFVIEILKEINQTPELLEQHLGNQALLATLHNAFIAELKWLLPVGEAPFKHDVAPLGMTPANFSQETRRFYVFRRADLKPMRREILFVQLLEGVHPSEANLLLHVKDQCLEKLFPNITYDLVKKYGIVEGEDQRGVAVVAPPKSVEPTPEPVRGRGRPPGAKNKPKSAGDYGNSEVVGP